MNNTFLLALSTLVGAIIGAGIFGLPFVIAQSGFFPAIFYFVVLGLGVCFSHLFFGEICLRTQGKHRLIGYAKIYLGFWGEAIAIFTILFGLIGTLLAYIILGGNFLHIIFSEVFSVSSATWSALFWLLCAFFVFHGRKLIAKAELFMTGALFLVLGVVVFFALPFWEPSSISLFDAGKFFVPYGAILFTLIGWEAIPEIASLLKDRNDTKTKLNHVIVLASVITVTVSFLFSLLVIGVSGEATSENALQGLIPFLGKTIVLLGAVFGILAIIASFLVVGNYLKNSLRHDLHFPFGIAFAVSMGAPFLLFLVGFQGFIAVITIVGSLFIGIEAILVVLIFQRAKTMGDRVPEYSIVLKKPLAILFSLVLLGGVASMLLW